MGRQLPEIKLDSIPLSDTIDFLRDITSTNIFVNWRALEAAGIDRNSPVTLKLKNVAFRDVLSLIARDQGNGMNFKMENGVIVIDVPVQPARARKLTTKTYDVMQLLGNVNDDTLPAKMKNLEEVVRTTVQPMSWQDQSTGISAFQSQLIVTAADEVHAGVEQLLKMLERGDGATTKPSTQRAWFESR